MTEASQDIYLKTTHVFHLTFVLNSNDNKSTNTIISSSNGCRLTSSIGTMTARVTMWNVLRLKDYKLNEHLFVYLKKLSLDSYVDALEAVSNEFHGSYVEFNRVFKWTLIWKRSDGTHTHTCATPIYSMMVKHFWRHNIPFCAHTWPKIRLKIGYVCIRVSAKWCSRYGTNDLATAILHVYVCCSSSVN